MKNPYLFSSEVTPGSKSSAWERANSKPTLFISCDAWLAKHLKKDPNISFDFDFFASDIWPNRPNSTLRLNLVNYQAIKNLSNEFDVRFIYHLDLPENLSEFFDEFYNVVIMQAPSEQSKATVTAILSAIADRPTRARIIFGTELTWFAELQRENFNKDQIRKVYTQHTLLRHTARTDVRAYADEEFTNSVIQEFEIGIDTQVVKPRTPILQRDQILFVKAPEGRLTKNNEDIEEIMRAIVHAPELSHLKPVILEPPYSTTEYWNLLQQTRYFIFTSIGETFSYVLNDAKASGTVSFFPTQMYENRSGSVVVDNYPDMTGRYANKTQLLERLKYLEEDDERVLKQSRLARNHVLQNFSLPKIETNWRKILNDVQMNQNSILFLDLKQFNGSIEDALELSKTYECQFLLPYLNQGTEDLGDFGYSWYSEDYDVAVIRDFLYEFEEELRWTRGSDGRPVTGTDGKTTTTFPVREALRFWRLLTRVNKISRIVTNLEPTSDYLETITNELHIYSTSKEPFRPVEVEYLPQV